MVRLGVVLVCLAGAANALPKAAIRRQVSQLRTSYDFVVVGGGTSGLTVADRLTEAFPQKTVLVVEYGDIEFAPGIFDPPLTVWNGIGASASYFIYQSLPNTEVQNKPAFLLTGKALGGSSAINGMFFDRGSRFDHDAWNAIATSGSTPQAEHWDWNGIFPFFKKSVTFTPPTSNVAQTYGYTWDDSVYGGSTPIYSAFPPYQWGDHSVIRNAWKDMGVKQTVECAGGDKDGLCWVPGSNHPVTFARSHAGLGHYEAVNTTRPNYDLIVKHQVTRVVYPNGNPNDGPPLVEVKSLVDGHLFNVTVDAEVILSAGALSTPAILQRSGIGPANFLSTAGIPLVKDLPGVGSNLQDHSGPGIELNLTNPGNLSPSPSEMSNPDFVADAVAGFNSIPATGPYTLSGSNSAAFVSLPNVTSAYQTIISKIRAQAASDSAASSFLPPDYRTSPSMVRGYKRQLSLLADLLSNPQSPSIEVPFGTGTVFKAVHLHPLSRGTVRIDPSSPLSQAILDYRTGTNPVDFDIYLAHMEYMRKLVNTTTFQQRGAVEIAPGPATTDLLGAVKDSMTFSYMHPCCTAAMIPEDLGGVVGTDLKVHGTEGLRVVDISVLPFLPGAHLSSTAYAIGEKAADIIIEELSRCGKGKAKAKGKGKGRRDC